MDVAAHATERSDLVRPGIPVVGLLAVAVAAVVEPGRWWEVALLLTACAVLALWARRDTPLIVTAPAVVLLVGASQLAGHLEPGLFLLSLLGIVLTGWSPVTWTTGTLLVLTLTTPVVLDVIQPPPALSGEIWVMGVLFPAAVGWGFHRQEVLTHELEHTRAQLAEQAMLEDRRRIARDVHDLVGHGLAAMMLQITGARHVLDRDRAESARALDSAEDIGRRTLRDLRRTVGALRDDAATAAEPLLGLEQIADIVADARAGGLQVDYSAEGPQTGVDATVGLTLFRIAQAALANAAIHAPAAHTSVASTVTDEDATLEVLSKGPLREPDRDDLDRGHGHYGLRGMQERADVVGGDFSGGPVAGGWLVRCRVPL